MLNLFGEVVIAENLELLYRATNLRFSNWEDRSALHKFCGLANAKRELPTFAIAKFDIGSNQNLDSSSENFVPEQFLGILHNALEEVQNLSSQLRRVLPCTFHQIVITDQNDTSLMCMSQFLGICFVSKAHRYKIGDLVEGLLHELTHMLLFYDDCVRAHFSNRLELVEQCPLAPSSIKEENRRVDLAFHSAVVAFEVARYRRSCTIPTKFYSRFHPSTEILEVRARETAFAILESSKCQEFLTSRSREILDRIAVMS